MPDRLATALADRYRLERELGQGGMATVYLAADLKHDRKVAIKVLKPELAAVLGAERFVVEIKTTAALQHPHILPLFDSGSANGFLFYVMPYIEGETLRTRLDREHQFAVDEAVRIAREVADALDYAHRHGVIHRDIKPENILLHDGRPMVADFGIALALSAAAGGRMTETGLSLGTPHYMSPEQATAEKEISGRSDVYSLASVLYEMLTGEPPHTGKSAQQIIMKIIAEPVKPVGELRKSVPPHVAAAVARALEKLPADRFESAKAFAEALANPAFTVPGLTAAGMATAARGSRLQPVTVGLGGLAVVATLAAGWFATRPDPEVPVRRIVVSLPGNAGLAGGVDRLALAPDGSGFVYAGTDAGGTGRLMYRSFAQLDPIPLAGTEGGLSPSFSPDGSRIAFLATAPFAVKVVALNGAPAITLATDQVLGGGVAWSADDWIYFDTGDRLDRIRGSGGIREQVIVIDSASGEVGFAWPDPLPNGKGLLFRSRRAGESAQSYVIKVLDLETREVRVLVPGVVAQYAPTGHLLYVSADGVLLAQRFDPDRMELSGAATPLTQGLGVGGFGAVDLALAPSGDLLYVSSSLRGGERFSWVRRDGTSQLLDPNWNLPSETVLDFALSPDGRRLAVSVVGAGGNGVLSDIWVKELDDGPLTKLTFEHINRSPTWSPDGRTIYYASARADDPNLVFRLHRISADGTGTPEPLPADSRGVDAITVSSRDGWVVMGTGDRGTRPADLLAFRPGVDSALMPLVETPAAEGQPVLSPDGRWLAYTSTESGTPEVYIRPFPDVNRGKWLVSLDGGYAPRWSSDGGALFYNTLAARFVMAPVRTSPTLSVGQREELHQLGPLDLYDVDGIGQRTLRLWATGQADSTSSAQLILVQNFLATLRDLK